MNLFPPSELAACLNERVFDSRPGVALPPLEVTDNSCAMRGRRDFLKAAGLALATLGTAPVLAATSSEQLIFAPDSPVETSASATPLPVQQETLRLGEIPADFWLRPRELWLRRQETKEEIRVVYWRDGQLVASEYWKACALLRDFRANVMTTMDPTALDVLRGVLGFYEAWQWPHPLVVTSGFRTVATNNALSREGAAKNSMHLYGKAIDLYIPGVPARDVAALGVHLQQGGVGFYPSRGFTHLDTGRLRLWRG